MTDQRSACRSARVVIACRDELCVVFGTVREPYSSVPPERGEIVSVLGL